MVCVNLMQVVQEAWGEKMLAHFPPVELRKTVDKTQGRYISGNMELVSCKISDNITLCSKKQLKGSTKQLIFVHKATTGMAILKCENQ